MKAPAMGGLVFIRAAALCMGLLLTALAVATPAAEAGEARTVAGFCKEGQQVAVPVFHEAEATATVLDAELRTDGATGGTNLVLLSVVEDDFSGPFWGLHSASPLAQYLSMQVEFPDIDAPVDCETVIKSCNGVTGSDWHTLLMLRCPVPEQFLAHYQSKKTNSEYVHNVVLSIQSVPSRGSVQLPLCLWEQQPATSARPSDASYKKAAVCVRPFRPYFFGTTTPSISKAQIVDWTVHHLNQGIDRIYLYDRYDAGRGPEKPTLENYLSAVEPAGTEKRVRIEAMPYFSSSNVTFDELVTKSYIYDQVVVMEKCFMQARREGVYWVLHIDFDEYMHFSLADGQPSLKASMDRAGKQCSTDFGNYRSLSLVVPRRTVTDAAFDFQSPSYYTSGYYQKQVRSRQLDEQMKQAEQTDGPPSSARQSDVFEPAMSTSAGQGWSEPLSGAALSTSGGQGWGEPLSGASLSTSAGQGSGEPLSGASLSTGAAQGWGEPLSGASLPTSAGQGWGEPFSGASVSTSATQGWGEPLSGASLPTSASQGWGEPLSGASMSTSAGQGWGESLSGAALSTSAGQGWGEPLSGAAMSTSAGQGFGEPLSGPAFSASGGQGWEKSTDEWECEEDPWSSETAFSGTLSGASLSTTAGQGWGKPLSVASLSTSAGQGWGEPLSGASLSTSAGQGWGVPLSGAYLSTSAGQGWGEPLPGASLSTSAGQGWGEPLSGASMSTSAGQGWGEPLSGASMSTSAGQGFGEPLSGAALSTSASQGFGQPLSGTALSTSAGQGWVSFAGKRCRRRPSAPSKSMAGPGTNVNLNNVKTAFAVDSDIDGFGFGVHHPCVESAWDVCVAHVDELWMDHLVDAYTTRSTVAYTAPSTASARQAKKPAASSWQAQQLHPYYGMLALGACAAVFVIAALAKKAVHHRRGHGDLSYQALSTSSPSSSVKAGVSIPATSSGRSRTSRWWSAKMLLALLVAAVVTAVSFHCRSLPSLAFQAPDSTLVLGSDGWRWMTQEPLTAAFAGQKVSIEFEHSDALEYRTWMGQRHSSYLLRVVGGPESVVAEVPCDLSTKTWTCKGSVQVCWPGTYQLELLEYTKPSEPLASPGDVWRKDALQQTVVHSLPLEVTAPAGRTSVDPRTFPGCGGLVAEDRRTESRKEGAPEAAAVAPEAAQRDTIGHWISVDCNNPEQVKETLPVTNAVSICSAQEIYYSSPKNVTWSTFVDWGEFFHYFRLPSSSSAASEGRTALWMPPLASEAYPSLSGPELAKALQSTWVHFSGDSVSFESFAAARSLLEFHNEGVQLLCALPEEDAAASGYSGFQPCEELLTTAGTKDGKIDRTSEHSWLWMVEVPHLKAFVSYGWSMDPAAVQHFYGHVAEVAGKGKVAKVLSLGHGLHDAISFNAMMATKAGLSALTKTEQQLWAGELHQASMSIKSASNPTGIFDGGVVNGPTSTALDIQAWQMDLPALSHMNQQLRKWATTHNLEFADALAFSMPQAWSWADSRGDYIDNVHFAGKLVWAFSEWKLNMAVRAAALIRKD